MAKRIRIGFLYSYNENWIGGTYYYQNLIQSLNLLDDDKKPHLVILSYGYDSFNSVKKLNYPYITYRIINKVVTFSEKITDIIKRKILLKKNIEKSLSYGIDVFFHSNEVEISNSIKKHLYWIPDMQELHLPHLFPPAVLEHRKKSQIKLLSNDKHILFSSQDSLNDFNATYPNAKSKKYVVNFSVFHPDYSTIDFDALKSKYNLKSEPYFFSPNQFWEHKNHMIILKAVKYLRETSEFKFQIFLSGKEYDSRNENYFPNLKKYVEDNNLEKNIKFLGFIDRKDQLTLMKNALAVIQPSLFEGWSSVVEDVKAMDQNLIVSAINVHKEQLGTKAYFFNPIEEIGLVKQMTLFLKNKIDKPSYNYKEKLKMFGVNFMEVITKMN